MAQVVECQDSRSKYPEVRAPSKNPKNICESFSGAKKRQNMHATKYQICMHTRNTTCLVQESSNKFPGRSQRREREGNTHTHLDRTHSLTHLHHHSYNHVVRSIISAITEFGIDRVQLKVFVIFSQSDDGAFHSRSNLTNVKTCTIIAVSWTIFKVWHPNLA